MTDLPTALTQALENLLPLPDQKEEEKEQGKTTQGQQSKTEDKQPEKPKKPLKKWPDNPTETLDYDDLIKNVKEVLEKGYKLTRLILNKEFEFEGFNIGKTELNFYPPPNFRLTEKCLKLEKEKFNRNLVDVLFHIVFLYGVEQGRRLERNNTNALESLFKTLERYRQQNNDLRARVDDLETFVEVNTQYADLSDTEKAEITNLELSARRELRLARLKADLLADTSRSAFDLEKTIQLSPKKIDEYSKLFNKTNCTIEEWEQILLENGWTLKEWQKRCKKKKIEHDFAQKE